MGAGQGRRSPGLSTRPVGTQGQPLDTELLTAGTLIDKVLMRSALLMWTPPDLAGTDGTRLLLMLQDGHRRLAQWA